MSGTDFVPFPLAVAFEDDTAAVFEIKHPSLEGKLPLWGNECLWTDPPPDHCFKTPIVNPVCKLGQELCNPLSGGLKDLSSVLSPVGETGYITPDADPNDFPPHLLPLIRVLQEAADKAGIDLANMDTSGISVTFFKK